MQVRILFYCTYLLLTSILETNCFLIEPGTNHTLSLARNKREAARFHNIQLKLSESNQVGSQLLDSSSADNDPPGVYDEEGVNQCVPIHEPICQGIEYTHTWLPNAIGLTTQEEAAKRMNDYLSLINVGCSSYLRFFLCTIYFPMCTPTMNPPEALQPCQNLCRYVQSKCEMIMKRFTFPWPVELNCDSLPSESSMCIQPENYDSDKQSAAIGQGLPIEARQAIAEMLPNLSQLFENQKLENKYDRRHGQDFQLTDPYRLGLLEDYSRLNSLTCTTVEIPLYSESSSENFTCARRCKANVFFRPAEKKFADIWMLGWSIMCMASSALTLVTFAMDRSRFAYPERPIIYLSASYFCYSLGFILRGILGRDLTACRDRIENIPTSALPPSVVKLVQPLLSEAPANLKTSIMDIHKVSFLVRSGHEGTWCTIIFLILYYFGHATYLWWVMLAVTWFLSASCKWGCEGIEAVSSVLHMLAWAMPALKTIIVLIMHRIDADELTGVCYVGFQDPNSLLFFVLLPQLTYLLIGIIFLAIGFYSLISVRANLKNHAKFMATTIGLQNRRLTGSSTLPNPVIALNNGNVRRLDKLMVKISIFSMLFIIPTVCVIGVNTYNFVSYPSWIRTLRQVNSDTECLSENGLNWNTAERCLGNSKYPSVEANMLQIFMSLVVGITSGMWVWCNRKSSETWIRCLSKKKMMANKRTRDYALTNDNNNNNNTNQTNGNNLNTILNTKHNCDRSNVNTADSNQCDHRVRCGNNGNSCCANYPMLSGDANRDLNSMQLNGPSTLRPLMPTTGGLSSEASSATSGFQRNLGLHTLGLSQFSTPNGTGHCPPTPWHTMNTRASGGPFGILECHTERCAS